MLEVIQLRRISFLFILGLTIISLAGCGEVEIREKISPDGSKVSVRATGEIKEVLAEDVESKLLEGYEPIAVEDVNNQVGYNLITPGYLPERFEHYGIYMRENPGIPTEKMLRQLWYDPEKNEVLMVTLMKSDETSSSEGIITFTDKLETSGNVSNVYPWAKYICHYEFSNDGIFVQGYMLVNDGSNRNEYEGILKSLNEETQSLQN